MSRSTYDFLINVHAKKDFMYRIQGSATNTLDAAKRAVSAFISEQLGYNDKFNASNSEWAEISANITSYPTLVTVFNSLCKYRAYQITRILLIESKLYPDL